ncbi:ABC transporter permease [Pseudaestuariivita atlantica]|uniref:Iron ABC transporter permease n=1 Tax=Pseudaestuariivita atlantica TaxID=1317121 RepID=A0A0L1JMW2_9RHOB|nr:iron ABC transporter permease [Pseudaestuariivita atlantica]KNG93089.1 iron ABC transporter permease [Pseudaestuariivita atlantica]
MDRYLIPGLALLVAGICLLPLVGVAVAAALGTMETLTQLAQTVLWRYIGNTLALVVLVGGGSIVVGTVTAWLVVATEFPGRRLLEIALVVPLAFPAYVLAYAYTDVLDHPGIVQTTLRSLTGWGPRDYWFPEIRSLGGAALMLTLVLYPYVYLLSRAAFRMQAATPFYAARSLGSSPMGAFLRVSLPMARPAIAAGALLVVMETIADFGTVAHFSVQTFATGIYTSWFGLADRAAAAQLALGLLAFALLVAALEYLNRGGARYAAKSRSDPFARIALRRGRAVAAIAACALPVLLGAVIPAVTLALMAAGSEQDVFSPRYMGFIRNSLTLAAIAAAVTVAAAVLLGTYRRMAQSRPALAALFIGRLGYAVPGGVIAVGLLVPFARFDNWLDARMEAWFDISTGLLISGSIWLLIAAYMIRFLAAAIGAYDSGLAAVTSNVDAASRVLGRTAWGTVRSIHLPVLRSSILTALLIVFVDTIKELPATLILRPFNYDTLAVQAFRLASDERLAGAAVPSLLIAGIGLVPVLLLCIQIGSTRAPRT